MERVNIEGVIKLWEAGSRGKVGIYDSKNKVVLNDIGVCWEDSGNPVIVNSEYAQSKIFEVGYLSKAKRKNRKLIVKKHVEPTFELKNAFPKDFEERKIITVNVVPESKPKVAKAVKKPDACTDLANSVYEAIKPLKHDVKYETVLKVVKPIYKEVEGLT